MANEQQRYHYPASAPSEITNPYNVPDNSWRAGYIIYFNRADPRSLVPKYSGRGTPFNFARPVSLLVTIIPLLLLGTGLLVALLAPHHFTAILFIALIPLFILVALFLVLFITHVVSLLNNRS
jgi:hypothetical protein